MTFASEPLVENWPRDGSDWIVSDRIELDSGGGAGESSAAEATEKLLFLPLSHKSG